MTVETGLGIYYGPDKQYHFDSLIREITAESAEEMSNLLGSMARCFEEQNNAPIESSRVDPSQNILVQCAHLFNKTISENNEWPEDEWDVVTDSITGEVYDINIWLDDSRNLGLMTIYKTTQDENDEYLRTEWNNYVRFYVVSLKESNEQIKTN